ncbi:MAG: hypothetical protein H7062_25470 [Candidatus Saccharimonas sp.]|nr:hypothetical protein [Planctomycetaceae bacterium]
MPPSSSAAAIQSRFASEQVNICEYVEFVGWVSAIDDSEVDEINDTLKESGLTCISTRPYDRLEEPFSRTEITTLLASLDAVAPLVDQLIADRDGQVAMLRPFTPAESVARRADLFNEWIYYFFNWLPKWPSDEDKANALRHALYEAEDFDTDEDDPEDTPDHLRLLIEEALETAVPLRMKSSIASLQHVLERFARLRFSARLETPDAEINILRQGFILLMTAFDAAVFDLTRVTLRKDFFRLIAKFGRQEKMAMEKLSHFTSFDEFRDQTIEEQLKTFYVKDLLFVIKELGVNCVDETNGCGFINLIELVMRRNVHVHNRGLVDERYLERDSNRKPKYNLHNLQLGDVAHIDSSYWEQANLLCKQCIDRLTAWATDPLV